MLNKHISFKTLKNKLVNFLLFIKAIVIFHKINFKIKKKESNISFQNMLLFKRPIKNHRGNLLIFFRDSFY